MGRMTKYQKEILQDMKRYREKGYGVIVIHPSQEFLEVIADKCKGTIVRHEKTGIQGYKIDKVEV